MIDALLKDLQNIRLYVSSNDEGKKLHFEFMEFFLKCINVQLADIPVFCGHLNDTLESIKMFCPIKDNRNWSFYENTYTQVQIILNLFKSIKNELENLDHRFLNMAIGNNDLLKIPNLKMPLLRLHLLYILRMKGFFYPVAPYMLYYEEIFDLLKIINEMAQNPNKAQFDRFISILNENHDLIPTIEMLFPYHMFKDEEHPFYMLLYWIPLFRQLYEHKITFRIEIIQSYEFVFSAEYSGILPVYILKEENSLYMSKGSKFIPPSQNNLPEFEPKKFTKITSRIFYGMTHLLFIKKPKNFKDFVRESHSHLHKFKQLLPNVRTNQYLFLLQLYQQGPYIRLISIIWPIVFNFSPDVVKVLIDILHPLESDIIKQISEIYSNICDNQTDDILDFTLWISEYLPTLTGIYDNQYERHPLNDIQEIEAGIDKIQREIKYFEALPALNLNIWFRSKCLNKLQILKIQLNTAFQPEIETRVILQLIELNKQLEKAIIKNKESYILKNQIVQHIFQIIEQSPNQENYIQCEKCVHHFLDFLEKQDSQISNSLILWPSYIPKRYIYIETKNIQLYKHVIWFSQAKAIVDRIDPHNKKIYEDIFELNKIPEMQSSAHLLTKELLKTSFNDDYEISPQIKDSINSTLNAHFILKMKKDNLLDKIQYLDKIFNDLSLRNEIKDQEEILWIHQIVNKYNPNLNIILPRFKPQDLFYLFVNYSGDVENLEKGPLISYIYYKCFQRPNTFDECARKITRFIGNELFSNPNTFDECAEKIARFIWCSVFNTDNCQFNHNELKSHFKQELKRLTSILGNKDDQKNIDLMISAIFVLDISPRLSSTAYKFYYNDITFLKTNWKKDFDFIQQCPSFVYWLIKYHECADKLQNTYLRTSFNENCLPFWLFSLRLMSSQNCIMLEIDSSTTISKIINKTIIEFIKGQIDNNNLSKLGTDWLSLVLSNVPSEFIVHNYHIFYEFFCHLCEDETDSDMLHDYKKTYEFLEKPFERLSENDWTSENVTDLDLAFIYDPNKFINQQIKVFINVLCRTTKYNLIEVEDRLNSEISRLEKSVKAEINKKKESFLLEQEKKRESGLIIDSSANNDNIPILVFGETKTSDAFINELKSTINIFSSFLKDVKQDIQNEGIKEEIFLKPKEISNTFEKISLLLTARFTDNTITLSIKYQLNELKQIYSSLILYANDFERELNNTIRNYYLSFPNNKCELFTHQYQLPFPSQEKVMTLENEIFFDSFAGAEFPSLPILFIEKDKENKDAISCCFDLIECSIGPIVPSLYSGKCIMNFLSFINTPFLIEVKTDDEHKDWFQTKSVINPGDPCQIYIKLPPSDTSNMIEKIEIETLLTIKSINSDLNSLELPCKFNFIIAPLSILISCKEHPLSFSNNTFYLSAPNIHSNSKLTFQFENIFVKDLCQIAFQLSDFDDNNAEKPEVVYNSNENELSLMIKNVINATRLHCKLKIRFSEDFGFEVEIDSMIAPLGSQESNQQPPEEEQIPSYLITINSEPQPHPKNQGEIISSTKQNIFADYKIINIGLPEIVIPSDSEKKSLSIQSLNKFYQVCTEATKRFPIYVKNMLILKSPEMQTTAKDYLLKLLQIYRNLPSKDYSFISASVNAFTYSFSSMVNKFEKAGVDFHDLVPKKNILNEEKDQSLIQYPEKVQITLPQDNLKSNEKT